jgi:diguanylate cyclase (GGDEF)-like protein/putative nucleotidyltransferase with HDIG domain
LSISDSFLSSALPVPPNTEPQKPTHVSTHLQQSKSRNPLLNMPIARRLTLGFLVPALIAAIALGVIGLQSVQLLSQESLFYGNLLHTYTSLATAKEVLQQMDTTMQGTLVDASQPEPASETLREDRNAVHGFATQLNTIFDKDIQQDVLDNNADLQALFTKAGHSSQIGEQRIQLKGMQNTWQAYRTIQEQVLGDIAAGNINGAQTLENSQGELSLTTTLKTLQGLTNFDAQLVTSVHDATTIEVQKLMVIIGLATLSVFLGIGLVGWLVSSTLVRRLHELRSVVQSIEKGKLDARLNIVGRDEVTAVSAGVNAMLDTIINAHEMETLHQALQLQHKELNSAHGLLNEANARLEALATTDALTGLPNHRSLVSTLNRELERAQNYFRSCSILFLDIDHFKALNDGYGHASGDTVLYEFAQVLQSQLRGMDTVGRWGGEEFVIILPEMTADEAQVFAEKLRADVEASLFNIGGGMRLTCSIGVACYPTHATEREALMNTADQAMYAAKRLGRNQVRRTDDPLVQALLLEQNKEGGREEAAMQGVVEALTKLVEAHDPSTDYHSLKVSDLLTELTQHLGVSPAEVQMIALAGRLHDIGKISIPDSILHKPGKLTEEEWVIMRTHSKVGAEVVSSVPILRPLASVIRAHHERWDGQGYPDQLAGEAIPFGARMIAVVDTYMAMTTNRPYQKACTHDQAIAELKRCAGAQFDPQMVESIERLLQKNPQMVESMEHLMQKDPQMVEPIEYLPLTNPQMPALAGRV